MLELAEWVKRMNERSGSPTFKVCIFEDAAEAQAYAEWRATVDGKHGSPKTGQHALRAAINNRLADCQERAAHFDQDARIKLKGKDWHGVEDAASDMRDEQARIEMLTWMLGVLDGE